MSYASDWEALADVQDAQETREPHLRAARSPDATYGLADDLTTEHGFCKTSLEYENMRHRWAESGQSFRLLDLPPELRDKIYEFVIGRELVPRFKTGDKGDAICTWGIGKHYGPDQWYYRAREVDKPNLALLQISKQVRYESFRFGWEDTIKVIPEPRLFFSLALSRLVQLRPRAVRRMRLDLRLDDFSALVREIYQDSLTFERVQVMLKNVDHLEIYFPSPAMASFGDVWKLYPKTVRCQKVIVDAIMNRFLPFTMYAKQLELTGAIKRSSREMVMDAWRNGRKAGLHNRELEFAPMVGTLNMSADCWCSTACWPSAFLEKIARPTYVWDIPARLQEESTVEKERRLYLYRFDLKD